MSVDFIKPEQLIRGLRRYAMLFPKLWLHCSNMKSVSEYHLQSDMDKCFGIYVPIFHGQLQPGNGGSRRERACGRLGSDQGLTGREGASLLLLVSALTHHLFPPTPVPLGSHSLVKEQHLPTQPLLYGDARSDNDSNIYFVLCTLAHSQSESK